MAGSTEKTLKLYEGGFHDFLNDIDKESVIVDIKSWIDRHIPVAAGPRASTVRV
jgi:acylglycerol lipase